MWTKEFIKQVKNLGFKVKEDKGIIGIIADNFIIARVWKNRIYCIDTYNTVKVEWKNEHELFNLLAEYARTPIKDRGDTSKHIYKHNFIKTKGDSFTYLAIRQRPSISYPVLQGSNQDIFEYKVEFTDEEIEEVKKEYGIFLDDFKKLEVEDEN